MREQGQYIEAEFLLLLALTLRERHLNAIDKRCLGAQHPETARTMENLAFLYLKQGRYRRAEPLMCRALCIHAQHSGWESPDTAYPLYGLAELWRVQKKYTQSESLHQYVLALRQQCLGEEHLDTAESLQGLADLCREWEKYEEAASLYMRSLKIREKVLGWESPSSFLNFSEQTRPCHSERSEESQPCEGDSERSEE